MNNENLGEDCFVINEDAVFEHKSLKITEFWLATLEVLYLMIFILDFVLFLLQNLLHIYV